MKLLLNLALLGASVWSCDAQDKAVSAIAMATDKQLAAVSDAQYHEIATAIAKNDFETLNALLDDVLNSTENGVYGMLLPRAGFLMGWEGIKYPVLDSAASHLEIGVTSRESPEAKIMHTALSDSGEFVVSDIPVKTVVDDAGNMVWYLDIKSAMAAGVGVLSVALSDTDVLLYPVLERLWPCKGSASSSCSTRDYACFVKMHGECVDGDNETSIFGRVAGYVHTKYPGGEVKFQLMTEIEEDAADVDPAPLWWKAIVSKERVSSVPVISWMDETGAVHPCEVQKELTSEGDGLVGVQFRVNAKELNVTASEGLLIVDASSTTDERRMNEEKMMAQSAWGALTPVPDKFLPLFGWFWKDKTWTASGCFRVHDWWTGPNAAGVVHPLDRISVRVASSLVFNIFVPWGTRSTDQNGCYSISKTFTGPFASNKRTVRVLLDFNNNVVRVANPFDLSVIFTWGYFVAQVATQVSQNVNFGTNTFFGNSGSGPILPVFLDEVRRRQAMTFWTLQRYQDLLWVNGGSSLAFNTKYVFAYPTVGGVALDIGVQMIMVGPQWWDLMTVLHEASHVWHYQHMSGSFFPSILVDLLNGCSTHNCQETPAVGFLEGFAEFAANSILCGSIWNSWMCNARDGGKSFVWLRNHAACLNPGNCLGQLPVQPGLTNVWRLIRNDDGNTHGLMLLIDDNFYRRNFQGNTNSPWGIATVNGGVQLNPSCLWYPNQMTLWQVMRGFLPAPGLPSFVDRWTTLLSFYSRLRSIYEPNDFSAGWFEDRLRFLETQTLLNPWQICRDPCPNPAIWWDSTPKQGWYDFANCVIGLAPAGAFIQNNKYYIPRTMTCPAGSVTSADPMCYVMTLTPPWDWKFLSPSGTSVDAYWTGGMFGTCPNGYTVLSVHPFLGTRCRVYTAPAGHTVQVRQSYQIWVSKGMSCSDGVLDSVGCYMGHPPAGTNAFVWGTTVRWYYTPQ
ncbi:hypothetical protein DIPPA_16010 [Diplonema papillatum]|nr:hypothetical protein DIPPA_16010 [Diplonema papillatum]